LEISKWLKITFNANCVNTGFTLELKKQSENPANKFRIIKKQKVELNFGIY